MEINWSTMLIQGEDGLLYYKVGEELVKASMTDIQKHYKTMQYNLNWTLGCHVTDMGTTIESLIGEDVFEKYFWKAEYQEIPENAFRVK